MKLREQNFNNDNISINESNTNEYGHRPFTSLDNRGNN